MNGFDRFCAVLAGILGAAMLLLGTVGLFIGSSAHFSLPPILGGLPALVGWGIIRSVMFAWKMPAPTDSPSASSSPPGDTPQFPPDWSPPSDDAVS